MSEGFDVPAARSFSLRQATSVPAPMERTSLPAMVRVLDGHARGRARSFSSQFVENVVFAAVGLQVFDVLEQCPFQIVGVRFPGRECWRCPA